MTRALPWTQQGRIPAPKVSNMITIKNTQSKVRINKTLLHHAIQQLLEKARKADFDIGIWITTNKTIRRFNREFRHKDKPTDVLSFSADFGAETKDLGDIIVSAERVLHDTQQLDVPFDDYLLRIVVHGFCHLLGYDHETDAEFKRMQKEERAFLRALGIQNITA